MSIKRMADIDARRLIDARKLEDTIIVRQDNIPNYRDRFDLTFEKLTDKEFEPHKANMAKLAGKLQKPSHTGRNLALVSAIVVTGIILHETGYDTVLKEKFKRKWAAFKNGPAIEVSEVVEPTTPSLIPDADV